jgi:hypothetical protein
VERPQLLGQFVGELAESLLASTDKLELPLEDRNRRFDDAGALAVACALCP